MQPSRSTNPIVFSIVAAVLTLGLKFTAYWLTGSVGLLSDAIESLANLFAALMACLSLWYAAQPVDATHTYGHEKIEFFSSGVEGMLILVAATSIGWYAVRKFITPEPLEALGFGGALALAASLINLAVARLLLRVGRERGSIILEADGKHLMTDVWTSIGVLVGLGLVWLTGLQILDPIIAILVALNIIWTGYDLVRRSFNGLMDHALPVEEQAAVRAAIESQLNTQMHYHALRTRVAGTRRFVDFHLLVPGAMTVRSAHEIIEAIETAVKTALTGAEVTIHAEPIEERAAWEDSALLRIEETRRAVEMH